jgi:hypothetical protein
MCYILVAIATTITELHLGAIIAIVTGVFGICELEIIGKETVCIIETEYV